MIMQTKSMPTFMARIGDRVSTSRKCRITIVAMIRNISNPTVMTAVFLVTLLLLFFPFVI